RWLMITCATAVGMRVDPGAPMTSTGAPSRETIVGVMPVTRPLPGAMEFGCPGSGWKLIIELLYMKPRPGVTTHEEPPRECVSATQVPAESTTDTCVVPGASTG